MAVRWGFTVHSLIKPWIFFCVLADTNEKEIMKVKYEEETVQMLSQDDDTEEYELNTRYNGHISRWQ